MASYEKVLRGKSRSASPRPRPYAPHAPAKTGPDWGRLRALVLVADKTLHDEALQAELKEARVRREWAVMG